MLPQSEIRFYRDNGYLIIPNVLDPAELAALRVEVARILEGAAGLAASNEVFDLEETHTPDAPRVRRIKSPHKVSRHFWDLIRGPRMIEVLTSLLGPDVRLQNA